MAAEGFFGRWSQRKLAERKARTRDEPPDGVSDRPAAAKPVPATAVPAVPVAPPVAVDDAGAQPVDGPPTPTLQDVAALHKESDFSPYVARAVQPEVRNAAMKKLFSDPHFNVMDGLDTYIDDYAKPDPLPVAMLRKMASAQFLNLFDDKDDKDDKDGKDGKDGRQVVASAGGLPREDADGTAPAVVAQSPPASDENPGAERSTDPDTDADPTAPHDEDTDLRLQPDDAAGPARAGRGAR